MHFLLWLIISQSPIDLSIRIGLERPIGIFFWLRTKLNEWKHVKMCETRGKLIDRLAWRCFWQAIFFARYRARCILLQRVIVSSVQQRDLTAKRPMLLQACSSLVALVPIHCSLWDFRFDWKTQEILSHDERSTTATCVQHYRYRGDFSGVSSRRKQQSGKTFIRRVQHGRNTESVPTT